MVKIQGPNGRLVDAILVDFDTKAEPWATYELSDGTVIKMRVIPNSISRLEGEFDSGGSPAYAIQTTVSIRVVSSKIHGQPTLGAQPVAKQQGDRDPSVG